jgi:predicted GIY-YIG superfamily endonuclease
MKGNFTDLVARMEPMLDELLRSEQTKVSDCKKMPEKPGVYLLSENGENLFVGRAKSLRKRMAQHGARSHYSASFALKLARKKTNRLSNYKPENGAKTLMKDEGFKAAFLSMVARVKKMDAHHIVEPSDHLQYLFEMYASLQLNIPYCDFATH